MPELSIAAVIITIAVILSILQIICIILIGRKLIKITEENAEFWKKVVKRMHQYEVSEGSEIKYDPKRRYDIIRRPKELENAQKIQELPKKS